MAIIVDQKKCPQNHRCPMIGMCPVDAISQEGYSLPVIDHNRCIECGVCIKICPMRAVKKGIE